MSTREPRGPVPPIDTERAAALLAELGDVDPPATLAATVMSGIRRNGETHASRRPIHFKRGRTMAKKVLWSVAAAAAVVLIVMRATGYPPVSEGTEATIGAAQRYQAPQIASADVKLEDADLQAFLQSDDFRRLAADKEAREALGNKDLQLALNDAAVRAALARSEVRSALADAIRNAVGNAAGAARLEALNARVEAAGNAIGAARLAALNLSLDAAARAPLAAALQNDRFFAALAAEGVAQAIASSQLSAALAAPQAALALSQQAVLDAVSRAGGASLDVVPASTR